MCWVKECLNQVLNTIPSCLFLACNRGIMLEASKSLLMGLCNPNKCTCRELIRHTHSAKSCK